MVDAVQSVPPRAPEPTDVDVRSVAALGALLGLVVVICAIAVLALTAWLTRGQTKPDGPITSSRPLQQFASPRLQAEPADELAAFKREKARKLQRYAWVDREHGVVQIPIERAMERMVERARHGSGDEDR
jgi:hypothetical protein